MNKLLILLALTTQAQAEENCARIIQGSKLAQVIPVHGKVKTKVFANDVVNCGSMITTLADPVWFELNDQTLFKLAPHSFFEISHNGMARHQLYRGSVLVTAPPSIREFVLNTPNADVIFQGGVALVNYSPKNKETSLGSFNRKIVFKNRFEKTAEQVVSAGEVSKLWIGESRIIPSQPEVMNPNTVKVSLQQFGIKDEEINEYVSIVTRVVDSRSKSLVAELESWEDIEREAESNRAVQRSIASLGKDQSSIDAEEAAIALHLLKKHLYGDETDHKIFKDTPRVPASVRNAFKFKDSEYQRKKAKVHHQVQKVIDDIRHFDPENE